MARPAIAVSRKAIVRHWAPWLVQIGKAPSVAAALAAAPDWCFACGLGWNRNGVDRSHIQARRSGGGEHPGNLHLLCASCHALSELLRGGAYWRWLCRQEPPVVVADKAIERLRALLVLRR